MDYVFREEYKDMAYDLINISAFMREASHVDFHGKKLLTLGKLGICITITQMYDFAERIHG